MEYYKTLPADLRRLARRRILYTREDLISVAIAAFCGGVTAITLVYAAIVTIGGPEGVTALCGGG